MEFEIDWLKNIRKQLHINPELSHHEKKTAEAIDSYLKKLQPDLIVKNIGGNGIACLFSGKYPGKTLLFRCELDALPIDEVNSFEYKSVFNGVSHKCGHDGHMSIMLGLAVRLHNKRPKRGKVILLFQPAEETGEGAQLILSDEKLNQYSIDYVFALHNLPGFKENTIIVKYGVFASASVGVEIKLFGKTSHAGEPEKGINPAKAVSRLIHQFLNLQNPNTNENLILVTIIHILLGKISYGTSAGYAELRATLRTFKSSDLKMLIQKVIDIVDKTCKHENLENTLSFLEEFPASKNDEYCNSIVCQAAKDSGLQIEKITVPFRWSEDFGHFLNVYKGAIFGLGAGIDHPKLHNPDYDFPDGILKSGINIFYQIIKNIQG